MPILQSSGAISMANLRDNFGAGNPVSLSSYYRGGSLVPATKGSSTTITEGPTYSRFSPIYYVTTTHPSETGGSYYWNGSFIGTTGASSLYSGGYTYYKGSYVEVVASDAYNTIYGYRISRSYISNTTTNINGNVPTSGTISLSNFYGAEKP